MKRLVFIFTLSTVVLCSGCRNLKNAAVKTGNSQVVTSIENPLENTTWQVVKGVLFDGVINSGDIHEEFEGQMLEFRDGGIFWNGKSYKITDIKYDELLTEEELYNETRGSQSKGYTFNMLRFSGDKIRTILFEFEDTVENRPLGYHVYVNSDKNIWAAYNTVEYWFEQVVQN